MNSRRWCSGAAFLLSVLAGLWVTSTACLSAESPPKPTSNRSIEEAKTFHEFPLYWLGESYQGLPLTVLRVAGPAYTHDHVNVRLIYGGLKLRGSCASLLGPSDCDWHAPLEIDIYHRCDNPPDKILEWLDEDKTAKVDVLGVDGYISRYSQDEYFYAWSGTATIHLQTWKSNFDIEEAASHLIPIHADTDATPQLLPQPASMAC